MAKLYTVTKVQHNVKGPGKTGTYDGTLLSTMSEGGAKRADFIFKSRGAGDQGSVVEVLAAGDKVELKIVKNGEYFNLSRDNDAIKLVEKGNGTVASPVTSTPSPATPKQNSYQESPEKQASIQRQNALTNATNLVSQMLSNEMFKKTIKVELLVDEILKVADKFYGYTSGETKIEALTSTIPNVAKEVKEEDPFDSNGLPE